MKFTCIVLCSDVPLVHRESTRTVVTEKHTRTTHTVKPTLSIVVHLLHRHVSTIVVMVLSKSQRMKNRVYTRHHAVNGSPI